MTESEIPKPAPLLGERHLTCGVCGEPIAADGSGALHVRVLGEPWRWAHLRCADRLSERLKPMTLSRELVLELFERSRAAGRIRERGHG